MDPLLNLENELNLPSPLQEITAWSNKNVKYSIKRDDLIDPYISGNKYRKLKGHLSHYLLNKTQYPNGILTYGGAFSNHLYATASACQKLNIPLTALVRGLEVDSNNSTLAHLNRCGCQIFKISRTEYRQKNQGATASRLITSGNYLIVPEGGNSPKVNLGVKDLVKEIYQAITPDYLCIMSGTGATAMSILNEISGNKTQLLICSAVRDDSVKQWILDHDINNQVIWREELWGGFGKRKPELIKTMNTVIHETSIPLEYVYTGRLMAHLTQLRQEDYFPHGSHVVIIHTGGLRPSSHFATTLG